MLSGSNRVASGQISYGTQVTLPANQHLGRVSLAILFQGSKDTVNKIAKAWFDAKGNVFTSNTIKLEQIGTTQFLGFLSFEPPSPVILTTATIIQDLTVEDASGSPIKSDLSVHILAEEEGNNGIHLLEGLTQVLLQEPPETVSKSPAMEQSPQWMSTPIVHKFQAFLSLSVDQQPLK